jgi:hypothetical protein
MTTSTPVVAYDSRTALWFPPTEVNLMSRPRGGRIPRKGNTSARAVRRAQERAERKAVRR